MRLKHFIILCCAVILAAGCGEKKQSGKKVLKIGMMPKLMGIEYFNAVEQGAREAAEELGVELLFDGPISNDVTKQSAMIETWIARKYDVIAVAPNDPDAIVPVLKKAQKRGIKVLTYDADAQPESRSFFVNQATYDAIAQALVNVMVDGIGPEGKYIILTGSLTAVNQNIWMKRMEAYRQEKFPKLTNLSEDPKASEEDQALATQVTTDILKSYPDVDGIFAITSVALPGAAEALKKAQAEDKVFLTGLATPNAMRTYVKEDIVKKFVLWNPVDLGYLTVQAAKKLVSGELKPGMEAFEAGRMGKIQIEKDMIIQGPALVFDKNNIDQFKF